MPHRCLLPLLFAIAISIWSGCSAQPTHSVLVSSAAIHNPASHRTPDTLAVMSFNLRRPVLLDGLNHWPHRKASVVTLLRQHQPDLIGMQECVDAQASYLLDALPGYAMVGAGRRDGGRGGEMSPIFYRTDRFDLLAHDHFWLSKAPGRPGSRAWGAIWPRMVTWARLRDRHAGRDLFLFNTHFSVASATARGASAQLLRSRIDQIAGAAPVLVTGDFNAGIGSTPYRRMTDSTALRDTYRVAHPAAGQGIGTRHNFLGGAGGPRIDWVLASTDFEVLHSQVLRDRVAGRYVSDHHPVLSVLRTPPGPALMRSGVGAVSY